MPLAMERSLAMPVIRARLPWRKPMSCPPYRKQSASVPATRRAGYSSYPSLVAGVELEHHARTQHAPGSQRVARNQVGDLEFVAARNRPQRFATADNMGAHGWVRLDGVRGRHR